MRKGFLFAASEFGDHALYQFAVSELLWVGGWVNGMRGWAELQPAWKAAKRCALSLPFLHSPVTHHAQRVIITPYNCPHPPIHSHCRLPCPPTVPGR